MHPAQASIGLVIFISFFLVAAVFEGNYGEDAVKDDSHLLRVWRVVCGL